MTPVYISVVIHASTTVESDLCLFVVVGHFMLIFPDLTAVALLLTLCIFKCFISLKSEQPKLKGHVSQQTIMTEKSIEIVS